MRVQYYPAYSPPDPATALEENLRRAYPAPQDLLQDRASDRLRHVLERLMEKAKTSESRLC